MPQGGNVITSLTLEERKAFDAYKKKHGISADSRVVKLAILKLLGLKPKNNRYS